MARRSEDESARIDYGTVTTWRDLESVLQSIRAVEYALGLLPDAPSNAPDLVVAGMQLQAARSVLGRLALALSEGEA